MNKQNEKYLDRMESLCSKLYDFEKMQKEVLKFKIQLEIKELLEKITKSIKKTSQISCNK